MIIKLETMDVNTDNMDWQAIHRLGENELLMLSEYIGDAWILAKSQARNLKDMLDEFLESKIQEKIVNSELVGEALAHNRAKTRVKADDEYKQIRKGLRQAELERDLLGRAVKNLENLLWKKRGDEATRRKLGV